MIIVYSGQDRIRKVVYISEEGLIFRGLTDSHLHKWENITNIFLWPTFNVLTVIDAHGKISSGKIHPDRTYGCLDKKLTYIFEVWADSIRESEWAVGFEYPEVFERMVSKRNFWDAVYSGGGGTLFLAFTIYVAARIDWENPEIENYLMISVGVLFGLFCIFAAFWGLLVQPRKKKWTQIRATDSTLEVEYNDDTIREFDLRNVKKHTLRECNYIGKIKFTDGAKMKHLERVKYWPILREYLLSKLEPSEKTKE